MRKDMHKVLTERPRAGKYSSGQQQYRKAIQATRFERRYYHDVEIDTSPKRESMLRPHRTRYSGKEFSDLISPLERYLISQVGQSWDKVWSEICKVLKGNGLQANHVKDHVRSYVGGIPHSGKTYFGPEDWHRPRGSGALYVDEHGILRRGPERSRKWKRPKYHYRRESELVEYHPWKGCWFRVQIGFWENPRRAFNGSLEKIRVYVVESKRQLSKREVRELNLENHFETRAPKVTLERD